jgi:hypothetical protein
MESEPDDFPGEDLPYTVEKLKRRGFVARLYYGAGLRKLEDDYLNPKRGDVLASQRRYRRYLAGDKRVVEEASLAVWSPLILAAVTPVLIVVTMIGAFAWKELSPYLAGANQTVSSQVSSHEGNVGMPTATPVASPDGAAGNAAQPTVAGTAADSPTSDSAAPVQQTDVQMPAAPSTVDASSPPDGNSQDAQVGLDLSAKSQALLAQAEQQFDAGQYQDAAATTEAILEVEPENVSAQRLHAAALRNLATVTTANAAAEQGVSTVPSGPTAQTAPLPGAAPCNPTIAGYQNSSYGRHIGGR